MNNGYFPPGDPPLTLDKSTNPAATWIEKFNPGAINSIINKHVAELHGRPTAKQLRDWMNNTTPIPPEHHAAIYDTILKMDGMDMMRFRQNNGSSIRGFAHLVHETEAYSDRVVHYIDAFSDIGDPRERWDSGYAGIAYGL